MRGVKYRTNKNIEMLRIIFRPNKWKYQLNFQRIALNTIPKTEKHMLVMDKFTHAENLYQPLQTDNEQYKKALTFLSGYNGIFNVTNKNKF